MATIYIDKKSYEVKAGKNLLEACLSLGFNLPYFCWHPALGSVGACRQCAVKVFKDEEDTKGRLIMSCMEPVRDNLFVSIDDPLAKAFRSQIIEWLMTNHPHDCAVCDEGGSCHLQDMTVMTGHNYRRFDYKKRTYKNQYLGPFLNHEMNRCIQCYRCVRFYKDYAGGKDLDVYAAHDNIYFGREKDGVLENEFSGNLAEVCPTGVFTDKTLKKHYTRKWDFTMAPSICQHCSLGCNIIAGERYGELRQITTRFNSEVNGYFICDRGRFGYEYVNDINRVQHSLIRGRVPEVADKPLLYKHLQDVINNSSKVLGIGSPRASLESNYALRKLVGKENFYQGVPEIEAAHLKLILKIMKSGKIHIPSLKEIEEVDAILILGEDVTNSAPRLALSLRQAVQKEPLEKALKINIPPWHDAAVREITQQDKGDLYIAYPTKTKLDELAKICNYLAPDEIARLGYAIAYCLNEAAPVPNDLPENTLKVAREIALGLKNARKPLIIAGTSLYNEAIIKAASNIAFALTSSAEKASDICFIVPECNSIGLAMMDAGSLDQAEQQILTGEADALIVLENDLYRRKPGSEIDQLFKKTKNVIVLDHLHNATTSEADILIPSATFAEADGTLVNNEGRAQRFFQVFMPQNENIRESWRWLNEISILRNIHTTHWKSAEDVIEELVSEMPQFLGAETVSPPPDFRIAGQKIAREPHRYSGRTAMLANLNVSEPKPPVDEDSPMSFTMEGYQGISPAPVTPFFWSPGWNSIQAVNKYQIEVGGPLHGGDPGKRLFHEDHELQVNFLNPIPAAFKLMPAEWLIIPLPHIFGSEELSIYTEGIRERTPEPYLAINKKDAIRFDVEQGEYLDLEIGNEVFKLPVEIKEELSEGCAAVPFNIPPLIGIVWPAKGKISKEVAI
jgi:NADH-quinone oxidoreductase subunit G